MPEQADLDLQKLSRVRVLHLERTEDAKRLGLRWRYYRACQHDDLPYDFDFRARQRGASYMQQRALGFDTLSNATAKDAPISSRRPSTPSSLLGEIVETYTAALLGPGRRPTVSVIGDPDSTQVLTQLFEANWDALFEVRLWAGAQGAAAILPRFVDGQVELRGLRAQDVYVEWSSAPGWIPRVVIEQKLCESTYVDSETGEVCSGRVWRTRAWDERYAYVYEDVPEDFGKPTEEGGPSQRKHGRDWIELSEAPIEHRAGRCPVVWLPNTHSSEDPIGDTDVPEVSCERLDRLDVIDSMIVRGTIANCDPTLVIKDRLIERRMWPMRAKGFGQKIELSEAGDTKLLEMSGKTIETAILTAQRLEDSVSSRTGHIMIKPDQASAMQSGVALQILRGTQNNRIAVRRGPLGNAISQIAKILLNFVRAEGIKAIGAGGRGIEMSPVEQAREDDDEPTFDLPKLGPGRAIAVGWGELYSPTPTDLQALAQSSTLATGGRAVVSQRTAVGMFASLGQTGVPAETEIERIREEEKARVASFESSMKPDSDDELEAAMRGANDPTQQEPAVGKQQDVQKQALNGAQQQAMLETFQAAGVMLSPEAALFALQTSIPDLDVVQAEAAIAKQIEFAAQQRERMPKPETPSAPESPIA